VFDMPRSIGAIWWGEDWFCYGIDNVEGILGERRSAGRAEGDTRRLRCVTRGGCRSARPALPMRSIASRNGGVVVGDSGADYGFPAGTSIPPVKVTRINGPEVPTKWW